MDKNPQLKKPYQNIQPESQTHITCLSRKAQGGLCIRTDWMIQITSANFHWVSEVALSVAA